MIGWHHQVYGHELEQALGVGNGQGGLECCSLLVEKSWIGLSNQTELIPKFNCKIK